LLRELLESGRVDYAFISREELNKREQILAVRACGESKELMLCGDYRKKVGEYMLDVGAYLGL
jgi:hypothetical protein